MTLLSQHIKRGNALLILTEQEIEALRNVLLALDRDPVINRIGRKIDALR